MTNSCSRLVRSLIQAPDQPCRAVQLSDARGCVDYLRLQRSRSPAFARASAAPCSAELGSLGVARVILFMRCPKCKTAKTAPCAIAPLGEFLFPFSPKLPLHGCAGPQNNREVLPIAASKPQLMNPPPLLPPLHHSDRGYLGRRRPSGFGRKYKPPTVRRAFFLWLPSFAR